MGEVYKARDTRLDRVVAIKVLPGHVAADPQLRERFDREAKAISSLNHPHICALYDVGSQDGIDFLVMEYLDGETLADRIVRTGGSHAPVNISEVLTRAIEIADALDKAHRAGIIHRDLKPGNIMLTKAGAKLLDFGLAKSGALLNRDAGASALPTTPATLTAQGTILGTFQYMAPEQLEGFEADARSDLFAFGAVLYEMLSGRRAFDGTSQASVIAAIMHTDPPLLSTLQPILPVALERAIHTCLAKDPDDRWQSARDLCRELKWIGASGSPGATASQQVGQASIRRAAIAWGAAAVMTAVAAASILLPFRTPVSQPVTRFVVQMPPTHDLFTGGGAAPVLSPDGRTLVYIGTSATGGRTLYVRRLDQLDPIAVQGPSASVRMPFVSPDGQSLGFFSDAGLLQRVSLAGGAVTTVAEVTGRGGTWRNDGTIVFSGEAAGGHRLFRVQATGGIPSGVTSTDAAAHVAHMYPHMLPDGSVVAYTVWSGSFDSARIAVRSIDTKEERVLFAGTSPRLLPTGHLIYARQNSIWAVSFDAQRLQAVGEPLRVVENVQVNSGGLALFAVSANGTLAYVPGISAGTLRTLAWVDRQGREVPIDVPRRAYISARLSPDGGRVALDVEETKTSDIWIWDDARSALVRFTADPGDDFSPEWTPDGRRIVFTSTRTGSRRLFWQAADGTGTAELLVENPNAELAYSPAPDRSALVVTGRDGAGLLALGATRQVTPLIPAEKRPVDAAVAPNGSWIAYESTESGSSEVYVRPFPNVNDGRWQVSRGGGAAPVWARSGDELFYVGPDRGLWSVSVRTKPAFVAGDVKRILADRYLMFGEGRRSYDVSPDGQRFLVIKETGGSIVVVQNWTEELKRLVPTR